MTEVAPKEKIDKPKKKLPLPRKRYVLGFFSIVLICGVVAYLLLRDTRPVVDCQKIIADSQKLFGDNKHKEYYEFYNNYYQKCIGSKSVSNKNERIINPGNDNVTKTDVLTKAAISAYKTNDKQAASKLADEALENSQAMSDSERNKMPDNNSLIMVVFMIKNGIYP